MTENHIRRSVFLDTNVFLDQLQQRAGMDAAERIFALGREGRLRICLSALTVVNVAYIMRKTDPLEKIKKVFGDWLDCFVILPDSDMDIYGSIRSDNPDFEDAMQLACADAARVDAIVTGNKKHFAPYTDIPVFTPDEFLAKITE